MQKIQKRQIWIFTALLTAVAGAAAVYIYIGFPSAINIFEGEQLSLEDGTPSIVSMQVSNGGVLSDSGSVERDTFRQDCDMQVKLFGIIPVRSIDVNVLPKQSLVPCGNAIGIKIITDGMLVVGVDEVKSESGRMVFPAKDYDIREGDVITAVNGTRLESTEQFGQIVRGLTGERVTLDIRRDGKAMTREVTAARAEDGSYKLGIWVRDSTAGIGTLTFEDASTGQYGALGHPVTDGDTGSLLDVSEGEILGATIFSVQKGEKGAPGELKGIFKNMQDKLGTIEKNTEQGIYGTLARADGGETGSLPAASRTQVHEGEAYILSNIDNEEVRRYDIEIQKVMRFGNAGNKDMVLHVTDPELLAETGGIVQGMSGSPIIQDGAIVGAVTHVFVNDPTRGYGIFIENMLQNIA